MSKRKKYEQVSLYFYLSLMTYIIKWRLSKGQPGSARINLAIKDFFYQGFLFLGAFFVFMVVFFVAVG